MKHFLVETFAICKLTHSSVHISGMIGEIKSHQNENNHRRKVAFWLGLFPMDSNAFNAKFATTSERFEETEDKAAVFN